MDQESSVCNQLQSVLQNSTSELNKQANILLQTLIGQIKKQSPNIDDKQIPTALFALLVSLLQQNQQDYQPYLLLLNMIINRVNIAIFKKFLIQIQSIIVAIQKKDHQKYGKYSVVILTQTIQVMSKEEFTQNDKHNMSIVRSIIDTLWSEHNLTRKEAQKSVKLILEQKYFFKAQISQLIKQFIVENLETNDVKRLSFLTTFLNQVITLLPIEVLGDINYALVKSLNTEDEEYMTHIYLCLETIMANRTVTVDICETLIKEFLNNQPSFYKGEKVVQAYGQCLAQTLLHLNTISPLIAKRYITSCIAVLQEIMLVEKDNKSLPRFAQNCLELLVENTIDASLWSKQSDEEQLLEDFLKIDIDLTTKSSSAAHFQKIIIMLRHMMTSRYHSKLRYVFNVYGAFFEQIDGSEACLQHVEPLLLEFLEFRREDKIQVAFTKCLGRLVSNIGSEYLLGKFPLRLQGNSLADEFEDINNLWLLPYFQNNAKKQRLYTFVEKFSPLIQQIANNVDINNSATGLSKEQRVFRSLHFLMWECFPNFVTVNGDSDAEIEVLAQFLQNVPSQLKEHFQHFENVLKGLQNIIINLQAHPKVQKVVSENAQNLISHLAKLIAPQKNKSKIILNVIGYLSQVAPSDYLDKAFKKNVTKLISDKKDNKFQASNMHNTLKNFDIINQILPSIKIRDAKQDASLLLAKTLIDEQNSLQKKTYRFLRILIHKLHSSFIPQIMELMENYDTVLNYSRPLRIQIIRDFWTKLELEEKDIDQIQDIAEFIQQFIPELIVGLRDSNKKCRRMAGEMIDLIGNKMESLDMLKDFVSMVAAGLAGETPLMKANSITAVSYLFEQFGNKLDKSFVKEIQGIILMLIKDENKEVYKAILYFLKKYQKNMTKSDLETEMPSIFQKIFSISDSMRLKFLPSIKQIISRLIRKFTVEKVTLALPDEHKNLPKSIFKAEKREKKQKEKLKNEKKKTAYEDQKHLKQLKKMGLADEGEDMEMEDEDKNEKEKNLLLKYDDDKQDFHFIEKQFTKIKSKEKATLEDIDDVEIKNGKLIVTDFEALQQKYQEEELGKKRKRTDRFNDFEKLIMEERKQEEEEGNVMHPNQRKIIKIKKKQFVHNVQESGESFKPQGNLTGGDVQKKNQPQPYAFVQLNPKALNKRHRNKAVKTFDHVLGGSKKEGGPATGLQGLKTKKVKKE